GERRESSQQPQRTDPNSGGGASRSGLRETERRTGRPLRRRIFADGSSGDTGRRPAPGGPVGGERGGLPRGRGDAGKVAARVSPILLPPCLSVLRPVA